MKKISVKWLIYSIIAALVCSLAVGVAYIFTKPSLGDAYDSPEVVATFSNLDVDIVVDQNGKYHISETFDVKLLRSGLSEVVRYVPYMTSTKYKNDDGSIVTMQKLAKVTNTELTTSGNERLILYYDEITGYITFGIRSVGFYQLNSTHHYTLSYVYDTGDDGISEFDEFYYNIVGHLTSSQISNVNFSVTFENGGIDADKVNCYYGEYGSTQEMATNIVGNTISGHLAALGANEGITLRVVFDNGYFEYLSSSTKQVSVGAIVALIIVLAAGVAAVFVALKYREKDKIMEVVEVTAPEFANPFIAEYYGDGESTARAATANIIYLANKGFIQIEPSTTKGEYKIIKAKEIVDSDEPAYIKETFEALFSKRDAVKTNEENYPYAEKALAAETIVNKTEDKLLYDEKAKKKVQQYVPALILVGIIATMICFMVAMSNYLGFTSIPYSIMTVVYALILGTATIMGVNKKSSWWMNLFFILPVGLILLLMYKNLMGVVDAGCFLMIISILVLVMVITCKLFVVKLNKEGKVRLERMLGFKNYIRLVETDRIKVLAKENPNYFYDVLPYAYAFGLSNVWVNKFKNLTILPPTWYVDGGANFTVFDYLILHSMFNSFGMSVSQSIQKHKAQVARDALNKVSSSSGGHFGGFSGGGGFAGGGSGGGGFGAR